MYGTPNILGKLASFAADKVPDGLRVQVSKAYESGTFPHSAHWTKRLNSVFITLPVDRSKAKGRLARLCRLV